MGARDVPGDGEAEARAALVLVAGLVETQEGLEDVLAIFGRNARPVVVDMEDEPARLVVGRDGDPVAVTRGVGNEVEEEPAEGVDADRDGGVSHEVDAGRIAGAIGIRLDLVEQPTQVGPHRRLAGIAPREGEIALQHAVHLVDVALEIIGFGRVPQHREREAEPRQDGAQVVADPVQHGRAVFDRALDAPRQLDEGMARLADLARPARPELHLAAAAEILRGRGELQDRPDLVAQEQDGDAEQHERGPDHPDEEDVRVRGVGQAAACDDPHHRVLQLDPDLDQVRTPDRVDPEGAAHLPGDLVRQRLVQDGEERLGSRRRQGLVLADLDIQHQALGGDAGELLGIPVLRIGLVDVDQRRDVGGDGRRQALRDELPVAFHEDIGDDRLQQHDRRDDDDEGARVEPLRQDRGDRAADLAEDRPQPPAGRAGERARGHQASTTSR